MKTMDRKIARRRHGVTEQRARRRLRIVIALVIIAGIAAAGFWIIRSPLLSVDTVAIHGAGQTDPQAAIERMGVAPGAPTISIDEAAVEAALIADPWIADARVIVTWPGSVEVEVTEHVPIALVQTTSGFAHISANGAVVQILDEPAGWPVIIATEPQTLRPGATVGGVAVLGALEFVAALPPSLSKMAVVSVRDDQQLTATVDQYEVRLGRSIDMARKAAALTAVIEHGVEPGSTIDVTAPRRPAVTNPQVEVEGEG